MRIIGNDHDYYDSAMAWGRDDAVVFLRGGERRLSENEAWSVMRLPRIGCSGRLSGGAERRVHYGVHLRTHEFPETTSGRTTHEFEQAHVVLAGTLHNGLCATARPTGGTPHPMDRRWIWKAEALRSYAADHGLEVIEGEERTAQTWAPRGTNDGAGEQRRIDVRLLPLDGWFAPMRLEGAALDALITERITIATFDPTIFHARDAAGVPRPWEIDQATLGAMEFAKAVDPYTAFQEIAMWKGGVLPSDGPRTVEIVDDKVKLAKAGFHDPTSFRRAKGGR